MMIRNSLFAIDYHHGQASRTILSGYSCIRGRTMRDKAAFYSENMSWIHESLLREPRGHRNMLGAILTEPVSDDAEFGLLFLHAFGLFDACGDSTFATACAVVETGLVKPVEPTTRFAVDTVLGKIQIEVDVRGGVVSEARFENVPSYRVQEVDLEISGLGSIRMEVAFGGLYYGFVQASTMGLSILPSQERSILQAAQKVFAAASDIRVYDAATQANIRPDLVTFVESYTGTDPNTYRVANVYSPGRMGRTPSGTGTSAHMALRAARGEYAPGTSFKQIGILGNAFTGTMSDCVLLNSLPAIRPTIAAKSYLMGMHHFMLDSSDPFARGFVLGD